MSDLRDRILSFDDITSERVTIREWGGVEIEMRSPTAAQRTRVLRACVDDEGNVDAERMGGMLIVASAFDPDTGELIFGPDDVEALSEKNAGPVQQLVSIAQRLAGLGDPEDPKDD